MAHTMSVMDYEEALVEHMGWPQQLGAYAKKPDGSLRAADLHADDKCTLGQWLHAGSVPQQRALPEYSVLKDAHAELHRAAADIVEKADARTLADTVLGDKGSFTVSLVKFLAALMKLRQALQ